MRYAKIVVRILTDSVQPEGEAEIGRMLCSFRCLGPPTQINVAQVITSGFFW